MRIAAALSLLAACATPATFTIAPLADRGAIARDPEAVAASGSPDVDTAVEEAQAECKTVFALLEATNDPERIAQLHARLVDAQARIGMIRYGARCTGAPYETDAGAPRACNCAPGDPLCSCL